MNMLEWLAILGPPCKEKEEREIIYAKLPKRYPKNTNEYTPTDVVVTVESKFSDGELRWFFKKEKTK